MKFAQLYNSKTRIFDVDTKDFTFINLEALYNYDASKTWQLNGFWLNNGKFGLQPIAILTDQKYLVNLPKFLVSIFDTIQSDCDAIDAIKQNKVGFTVKPYEKNGKTFFTIQFVDL